MKTFLALLLLPLTALAASDATITGSFLDYKTQSANPGAPRSGYLRSWISSDFRLFGIDPTGTVKELGGGGSSFNALAPLTFDAVSRNLGLLLRSQDIPNNAANTSGNAATATALATSPTQCPAGQHAMGVSVSGNAVCATDPVSGINQLTGDVTASGTGSVAATIPTSVVTGKPLTGFTSGAGTVSAADSILQAIQKVDGNVAANTSSIASNSSSLTGKQAGPLTGDVTTPSATNAAATIQPNAVTTAKINDGAVTTPKVNDAAVTTAKLADGNVTGAKLIDGAVDLNGTKTTGTLPITKGGTGQITRAAALTALAGTQTAGYHMRSDGTNTALAPLATSDLTGTVAIANGGTGQATKQAAFNALSPAAAKGDQLIFDGTNNIALTACADGYQRVFDSTSSSGFKCQLGNISLATNWTSYPMVITAPTTNPTKGTTSTDAAYWRRVGSTLEGTYDLATTAAGTNGSGTYLFSIPTGLTIDTSVRQIINNATGLGTKVGTFQVWNSTNRMSGDVLVYDNQRLALRGRFGVTSTSGSTSDGYISSGTFAFGDSAGQPVNYSINFAVPISQWSQSTTANIYDSGDFSGSTAASVITGTTTNPTKGTTTVDSLTYGRRGKNMNAHWDYVQTAAGTAGSGIYLLAIPGGLAVDTTIARANTVNGSIVCTGTISSNTNNVSGNTHLLLGYLYDSTHIAFKALDRASSADSNLFGTFSSSYFAMNFANITLSTDCANIPISTWSTFPVGVAAGNLSSGTPGVTAPERLERADVTCNTSSTINSQSGSWISSAGGAVSNECTLTIAAGIFSQAPTCTASLPFGNGSGGIYACGVRPMSATQLIITPRGPSSAALGNSCQILCQGPR